MTIKSGRGSISRAFSQRKRRMEDPIYAAKQREWKKKYYAKSSIKRKNYANKWNTELTIFANKRCRVCYKLLNHRTKGEFCYQHCQKGRKKK